MNPFESTCETFIIASESSETREPTEAAFYHPPSGKQNKAFPGLLKFDHLKLDSMLACIFGGLLSGIALVHPSKSDILAGDLLGVLGDSSRPLATRIISRRSCAMVSKQPALNQRWACW